MRHRIGLVLTLLLFVPPGLAAAEDKFFDSNGVQIRYVEQGSGVPVVLVHGYSGNIEGSWIDNGIIAKLAKDHHVVAFDNRGHGKSGKPHDVAAYGNEMAEDIVRLMDHLKVQRAHIIGYSMGVRLVERLLITHPDRVLTATLGGFGLVKDAPAADEKRAAETERGSFRTLILQTWPADQPPPTEEVIRQRSQDRIARGMDPVALAQVVRGFHDLAVTATQMAAVRVPTQAIVGSADPGLADVKDLKTAMPALKVTVVEGATHSGDQGTPNRPEFVNAIREFIDSTGKKPAQ